MFAVCSDCKNLANLDVCPDCKFTLCPECIRSHYLKWKEQADLAFLESEQNLILYKRKIGKHF